MLCDRWGEDRARFGHAGMPSSHATGLSSLPSLRCKIDEPTSCVPGTPLDEAIRPSIPAATQRRAYPLSLCHAIAGNTENQGRPQITHDLVDSIRSARHSHAAEIWLVRQPYQITDVCEHANAVCIELVRVMAKAEKRSLAAKSAAPDVPISHSDDCLSEQAMGATKRLKASKRDIRANSPARPVRYRL